jgi:hypothetical protein
MVNGSVAVGAKNITTCVSNIYIMDAYENRNRAIYL